MWFKELTGFEEISHGNVQNNIEVDGSFLISKVNNRTFQYGNLEVTSLESLRSKFKDLNFNGKVQVSEIVADVKELHCDLKNNMALFQAASQFNLLEMVGPHITPERGIDIYDRDFTQGPACAIVCGAGTIYRNYFVKVNGQIGQTENNQIDCLEDIGKELGNKKLSLWEMVNGYALVNQNGILSINKQLSKLDNSEKEFLKGKLKVGIQWKTEVTLKKEKQLVSQIYCSALPVSYSNIESMYWENFSRIILEATYEATLYTALINLIENKSNKVFLTLVGGGAFGNEMDWILESLFKAIDKFKNVPLDLKIVSYGNSNLSVKNAINDYNFR